MTEATPEELAAFGDENTPCQRYTGRPGGRCLVCHHSHDTHTPTNVIPMGATMTTDGAQMMDHTAQVIHDAIQEAAATYHPVLGQVGAVVIEADTLNDVAASTSEGGGVGTLTWEQAIHALSALRASVETIRQIDAALVRHLYLTAPHGDVEVEGIGVVGIRRSNDRKDWDHEAWKRDVRGAIYEEFTSSELFTVEGESVDLFDIIQRVQDVHGATAPKVTALRKLGLDPQAYCEERPGQPQVVFPRRG